MKNEYWLSFGNGAEKMRLPVNPEAIRVSSPFGFTDVEVSNLGEFSVIGDRGLKEFTFSSFFPKQHNPTYCEFANFSDPLVYVSVLERWRDSKRPCRLIVTGTNINYPVTIREFDYDLERAGNVGDIYYSLTLKEFRFLNIRTQTTGSSATAKPTTTARPPSAKQQAKTAPKQQKTYTVKEGDTLSKIAKRQYGDGNQWRKIYDANKSTIGKNPNSIKVGQKLVMP